MVKFRSTVVNADKTGVTSTFGDNRRITLVRRFVRAYKIDELIKALDGANIEPRPVWKPMHFQPLYSDCERCGCGVAEDPFRCSICLPTSISLSETEQRERRKSCCSESTNIRTGAHGQWRVRSYNVDKNGIETQASKISRKTCGRAVRRCDRGKRVMSSVPALLPRAERPESCICHRGAQDAGKLVGGQWQVKRLRCRVKEGNQ